MPARPSTKYTDILWLSGALVLSPAVGNAAASDFPFNMGRLPEADKFLEAMCGVNIETRELLIQSERWSHRLIVFMYPREKPHLWVWDPDSKSREIIASPEDPVGIAKDWVRTIAPGDKVTGASFSIPEKFSSCAAGTAVNGTAAAAPVR